MRTPPNLARPAVNNLETPAGPASGFGPVPPGCSRDLKLDGKTVGRIYHVPERHLDPETVQRPYYLLALSPTASAFSEPLAPAGTWKLVCRYKGKGPLSLILQIQRELATRRRKKLVLLLTRLAFLVMLPTILAGYYFYVVATPMFSTRSEFLILKAESSASSMGSLFSGTQFATNQDAIAVQSYLLSKDAMLRLDGDEGFKAHYEQDWIDPIQRLDPGASNEEAYKLYKRNIEIGYDPTEGVLKMEIMAADPETAAQFSRALIGYAEDRVDNLSLRKRSNAVTDAESGLEEAEQARYDAQERLVRLQQEGSVVDPEGRIAALRTQIRMSGYVALTRPTGLVNEYASK